MVRRLAIEHRTRMHWYQTQPSIAKASAGGRCAECVTRPACIGASLETPALSLLPTIFSGSETLTAGSHLYRPGDPADSQFHVRSGSLKTYSLNADGDEWVTGFYLPSEVLSNTQADGLRRDGAIALETTLVCRLRNTDVARLQEVDRLQELLVRLAQRETRLTEHQLNLVGTSAQARFAGFCLQYSARLKNLGRSATLLPLPMSRTDLASYLGMTLESLSRVTTKLSKVRLIRASRSEFELLDVETLKTLAVQGTY